jgi:hypothetical protein
VSPSRRDTPAVSLRAIALYVAFEQHVAGLTVRTAPASECGRQPWAEAVALVKAVRLKARQLADKLDIIPELRACHRAVLVSPRGSLVRVSGSRDGRPVLS